MILADAALTLSISTTAASLKRAAIIRLDMAQITAISQAQSETGLFALTT